MSEVVLEAVSPFGIKVAGSDKWVNADKGFTFVKENYHAGDAVELTTNAKGFITGIKVNTAAPAKAKFQPRTSGYVESPEKSAKMARGAAVKAVFPTNFLYEHVKDMSLEEGMTAILAVSKAVADYIEEGN